MAREIGISAGNLSLWKNGHAVPKYENLESLLNLLDVTLGQCLYFPDEVGRYREMELLIEAGQRAEIPPAASKK